MIVPLAEQDDQACFFHLGALALCLRMEEIHIIIINLHVTHVVAILVLVPAVYE